MSGNPTDHTIRSGTQLDHPEDRTVLADDDPRHGTLNAYVNHRCRCEPCRAARRSYGIERGELTGTGPRRATGPDAARINAAVAKERPEERHVCPLQLSLIRRCVELWTNPDELVFSPFTGIGSEGWEALAADRRFYGTELKESYYNTAARNLTKREREVGGRVSLFGVAEVGA